jgi:monovalent cation:H+ antiporter-2, CPA2 family
MGSRLLEELVIAYGVGVLVVLLLHRLRVPVVVGFLVAGVVVGPHGAGLVRDVEAVGALADIGVVILLFTIGVEMSVSRVIRMGAGLLIAGLLQMVLTAGGTALPAWLLSGSGTTAITLGLLVAASSTTLLLRILQERGEVDSPHGRLAVGISIVQDLCVVPIMILLPLIGGAARGPEETALAIGKAVAVLAGTVVLARWVVPRVFEAVVNVRSRELFALTVLFLCIGTAWLAGLAGLSLALGAFLGGLVVSESPYSQQVLGEMLPLRDGLAGLFFIGVGMLLDLGHAVDHAPEVLAAVAAILVFKTLVTALAVAVAGYGLRIAVLVGIALAQVGEFSFVLSREATRLGLLDHAAQQLFLAAAVLTMAASPFAYRAAARLADAADRLGRGRIRRRLEADALPANFGDHVILLGFGVTGRNVAKALDHHGRPWVVVEINPETVRRERAAGTHILYGDAGHPEVLAKAGIAAARLLVVAINDAPSARRVVELAKRMNKNVRVLVRTRFVREVPDLIALGADDVVPEELESSVELFARALRAYDLPHEAIERSVQAIRAGQAVRPRDAFGGVGSATARALAGVDLETHVVGPGAPADGKTVGELDVHRLHGVTIVGVTRLGDLLPDVTASTRLAAADVVVVVGRPERLAAAAALFHPPVPGEEPPLSAESRW